ncbi:hypothetical protein [Synechococcus sp. M16CYN]|uniref:hypothetical protein n=1 Tax=Synechococcus sp. M16CYN TaxID=3103139 RepID=UPI003341EBF9
MSHPSDGPKPTGALSTAPYRSRVRASMPQRKPKPPLLHWSPKGGAHWSKHRSG